MKNKTLFVPCDDLERTPNHLNKSYLSSKGLAVQITQGLESNSL